MLNILLAAFLSSSASACPPPPLGYFDFSKLETILKNEELRGILFNHRVLGVELASNSRDVYEVKSTEGCKVLVQIITKPSFPEGPCGGSITLEAKPISGYICPPVRVGR